MKEISVKGFGTCLNLCYNFYCISKILARNFNRTEKHILTLYYYETL